MYDPYRGVIAFVRVVDGTLRKGADAPRDGDGQEFEAEELGFMAPRRAPVDALGAGEVGYLVTGLKDVHGDASATRSRSQAGAAPSRSPATRR